MAVLQYHACDPKENTPGGLLFYVIRILLAKPVDENDGGHVARTHRVHF